MRLSGPLPRWLVLLLLLAGGLVLVAVPPSLKWQWDRGVSIALGQSLLIAALLAFTIDRWFRQDFAKDVFYGVFGGILRPEFRDEVKWLTSFKLLAIRSYCYIRIDDLADGYVKLTLEIEREFENISSTTEKKAGYIGVDEWQIPGHSSSIEECGISKSGQAPISASSKISSEMHLAWSTEEVSIEPGESLKSFSKSIEYRHRNDIHVLALTTPTKDPEVRFDISTSLQGVVSFTHRGKMEEEPLFKKRTLRGTYLPGQLMIVRWWPKPAAKLDTEGAMR